MIWKLVSLFCILTLVRNSYCSSSSIDDDEFVSIESFDSSSGEESLPPVNAMPCETEDKALPPVENDLSSETEDNVIKLFPTLYHYGPELSAIGTYGQLSLDALQVVVDESHSEQPPTEIKFNSFRSFCVASSMGLNHNLDYVVRVGQSSLSIDDIDGIDCKELPPIARLVIDKDDRNDLKLLLTCLLPQATIKCLEIDASFFSVTLKEESRTPKKKSRTWLNFFTRLPDLNVSQLIVNISTIKRLKFLNLIPDAIENAHNIKYLVLKSPINLKINTIEDLVSGIPKTISELKIDFPQNQAIPVSDLDYSLSGHAINIFDISGLSIEIPLTVQSFDPSKITVLHYTDSKFYLHDTFSIQEVFPEAFVADVLKISSINSYIAESPEIKARHVIPRYGNATNLNQLFELLSDDLTELTLHSLFNSMDFFQLKNLKSLRINCGYVDGLEIDSFLEFLSMTDTLHELTLCFINAENANDFLQRVYETVLQSQFSLINLNLISSNGVRFEFNQNQDYYWDFITALK